MKVYHYANMEDWGQMKEKHRLPEEVVHLRAQRRIGKDYDEAWKTGAVFALLEPTPESWTNNKEFSLTWGALRRDLGGRMLLEIEVDSEDEPNTFVVDRGYMEGFLYRNVPKAGISQKYTHETRAAAEQAYLESKVPIAEYMQRVKELNYSLPEVVITKHISLEKITVSREQPILQEILKEEDNEYRTGVIRRLQRIPELNAWYERQIGNETKETKKPYQVRLR